MVEEAARGLGDAVPDSAPSARPGRRARRAPRRRRSAEAPRHRRGRPRRSGRRCSGTGSGTTAWSPTSRAASSAAAREWSAWSEKRASGPHRYAPPSLRREWSAFERSTCSSTKCASYAAGAMSSPRSEVTRPSLDRVRVRRRQRDELAVDARSRESRSRPSSAPSRGPSQRSLERIAQHAQLPPGRRPVEAADTDVDRMDLPAAEEAHQLVARLLEREPAPHDLRCVARELDRAVVAEKVRRMEHVHVQRVALDPLAAVQEPPEERGSARVTSTPQTASIAFIALTW